MKNKTITTLHDGMKFNDREAGGKAVNEPEAWKLGLDVDLRNIAVAMQCGRWSDQPGQEDVAPTTAGVGKTEGRARPQRLHGV